MSEKQTVTICESGEVMTVTQEGITMPADYSFAKVNDFINGVDVTYEDLECLCLGMADAHDKLGQQRDEYQRLFTAAIRDIAAIAERLGIDAHEGGAVPIIEAIAELEQQQRDLLILVADIKQFDIQNFSLDLPQEIRARIDK